MGMEDKTIQVEESKLTLKVSNYPPKRIYNVHLSPLREHSRGGCPTMWDTPWSICPESGALAEG